MAHRRLAEQGGGRAARSRAVRAAVAVATLLGVGAPLARADEAVRRQPEPPMMPEDGGVSQWSGLYIGAGVGFGSGRASSRQSDIVDLITTPEPALSPSSSSPSGLGYVAGGELGYRWQFGRIVLGSSLQASFGSLGGRAEQSGLSAGVPYAATQSSNIGWVATIDGSVGYVPADGFLVYAKGGLGLGEVTNKAGVDVGSASFSGTRSLIQPAWVAGAGVEYKIDENWSAKLEYQHQGFGAATNVSPNSLANGDQFQSKFTMQADAVMAGLSYRFGESESYVDQGDQSTSGATSFADQYFSELDYDFGVRSWLSWGSMSYKLGRATQSPLISQLDYSGVGAESAEIYGRVGHPDGPFLKGFFGVGFAGNGRLTDQDFPPLIAPYSATHSNLSDGSIGYGAVDIGYDALQGSFWRLGGFLGYGFFREQYNAYGCNQVAGNTEICPAVSSNVLGISEDTTWNLLRVGLSGQVTIRPHLVVDADFAWVPTGGLTGNDTHWLRTDLTGPIKQSGAVSGVQLQAAVRYSPNEWLNLGLGARYWQFNATGKQVFQTPGAGAQATRFSTDRYGPFFQVDVRL